MPVTGADILRIERDLGLAFDEFVCRWADADGKIARDYAPHFRFADDPRTPCVVGLAHAGSRWLRGTSRCRFLVEGQPDAEHPLGVARCGIHASRPAACRCFPTKLGAGGDLAVIQEVPARGRPGGHAAYSLCPRPWEPADLDPLEAVPALVVARHEMAFFFQHAETWNRRPGAWERFPEFLRLVYANRVLRREPRRLEPGRREAA